MKGGYNNMGKVTVGGVADSIATQLATLKKVDYEKEICGLSEDELKSLQGEVYSILIERFETICKSYPTDPDPEIVSIWTSQLIEIGDAFRNYVDLFKNHQK